MLALGTQAPHFALPDVITGRIVNLADEVKQKSPTAVLVMFICRHCPYVKHVEHELAALGNEYVKKAVLVVAISSNDVAGYPEDGPEKLKDQGQKLGFNFPYCFDDQQLVAQAYTAACTPDFFVFDNELLLAYRGQLDDSRPGNDKPVTGKDLRAALDAILKGETPSVDQKPSAGCNIKWKPGLQA
jgi:peroxiredoxin